jgi:hypothetical protein
LAKRLQNGNLLVPARAESDGGGVIGDGMVEIGHDDPDYDEWVRELEGQAAPSLRRARTSGTQATLEPASWRRSPLSDWRSRSPGRRCSPPSS